MTTSRDWSVQANFLQARDDLAEQPVDVADLQEKPPLSLGDGPLIVEPAVASPFQQSRNIALGSVTLPARHVGERRVRQQHVHEMERRLFFVVWLDPCDERHDLPSAALLAARQPHFAGIFRRWNPFRPSMINRRQRLFETLRRDRMEIRNRERAGEILQLVRHAFSAVVTQCLRAQTG